jgi:hypothetical protein
MQRLTSRMVLLGGLALGLGCSGDPTKNKGTPTDIVAEPTVMFVPQGTSKPVLVTAIDEDGQALETDFTISNVGAGITATLDPTFLPTIDAKPIRHQARIVVNGVDVGTSTFTVEALGLSKVVTVTTQAAGP